MWRGLTSSSRPTITQTFRLARISDPFCGARSYLTFKPWRKLRYLATCGENVLSASPLPSLSVLSAQSWGFRHRKPNRVVSPLCRNICQITFRPDSDVTDLDVGQPFPTRADRNFVTTNTHTHYWKTHPAQDSGCTKTTKLKSTIPQYLVFTKCSKQMYCGF